jgi:hypothetical protein
MISTMTSTDAFSFLCDLVSVLVSENDTRERMGHTSFDLDEASKLRKNQGSYPG